MAKIKSFPFPIRNQNFKDEEIFYKKSEEADYINYYFDKITSSGSVTIANQFFSIENILNESFLFVLPIKENSQTSSVKFATIIREASNLFEIITRKIYNQLFLVDPNDQLNIFNFLSIDAFLNLSTDELRAPTLESFLQNNERIEPYSTLKNWNKNEELRPEHIPKWWTAYNRIKHNIESIPQFATLENALYSLSAVFLLMRKVYGDGLICGFLRKRIIGNSNETILYPIKTSTLFIGEVLKSRR